MKKRNYNKIFAMLLVVLMFCSCFTSSVFAQENEIATYDSLPTYATIVRVTSNNVNVRSGASTSNMVVRVASTNDVFTYVGTRESDDENYPNDWYEVIYSSPSTYTLRHGMIYSDYANVETRMLLGSKTVTSSNAFLSSSSSVLSSHLVTDVSNGTVLPLYATINGNYVVGVSTIAGSGQISMLYGYINPNYVS